MIAADRYVKDHTDDLFELPVDQQEFQRTQAFSGCELVHDTHRLALMNAMLHDISGPIYLGDIQWKANEKRSMAILSRR